MPQNEGLVYVFKRAIYPSIACPQFVSSVTTKSQPDYRVCCPDISLPDLIKLFLHTIQKSQMYIYFNISKSTDLI